MQDLTLHLTLTNDDRTLQVGIPGVAVVAVADLHLGRDTLGGDELGYLAEGGMSDFFVALTGERRLILVTTEGERWIKDRLGFLASWYEKRGSLTFWANWGIEDLETAQSIRDLSRDLIL